jgi:hypothetical protein
MRYTVNIGSLTHHSVVIIADNHLQCQYCSIVAAITDRGQHQHQENILLLLLAMLRNFNQKI